MTNKRKPNLIQPKLEDILPSPGQRVAFEEASAALEAGQLVRALRQHAGLSQVELASRLGVEQPRVSAIEAGRGRDGPSYAVLKRIVVACEIPWFIPAVFSHFMAAGFSALAGFSAKDRLATDFAPTEKDRAKAAKKVNAR